MLFDDEEINLDEEISDLSPKSKNTNLKYNKM